MSTSLTRRRFLVTVASSLPLLTACAALQIEKKSVLSPEFQLQALENTFDGRIGVFALDTATGSQLDYRATERFPLCSTFKVLAASALLSKSASLLNLQQRIHYQQSDLVEYSPVTEKHVHEGMTLAELCAAALQYSDNTAANLLIKTAGGPEAITAFARSLGDQAFRLDRWETELNTATPGDERDTTTPKAMGYTLQRLALGDALQPVQREQLQTWLVGNTTGASRIKSGIPADWKIGDKTGSGRYGTANDIAVLWPPQRKPCLLTIYTTQNNKEAKARNDIIASAARIAAKWLQTL